MRKVLLTVLRVRVVVSLVGGLLLAVAAGDRRAQAQPASSGSIKGHVRLTGKLPGNLVIRMGADPMCARINAGKRVVQESVAAAADGSLANVFVRLQGSLPQTPVSPEAVTIDQRGCIYEPRVVGVRVGQTLQVRNSDELLHNVHGLSGRGNSFNVSEPKAGMVQQFRLKNEEVMLRLKCDVHSWMAAFVGVVTNPFFAVSDRSGTFAIEKVPAGTYSIQAWQERYGPLVQTVRVRAGAASTIEFNYTGNEPAPAARLEELTLPPHASAVRFVGAVSPDPVWPDR
jgi:plastocyanin